jgi:hypothetical protein
MNGIIGTAFGIITMALFFAVPAIVGATLAIGTAQFADVGSQWCIEREKVKRPAMKGRGARSLRAPEDVAKYLTLSLANSLFLRGC